MDLIFLMIGCFSYADYINVCIVVFMTILVGVFHIKQNKRSCVPAILGKLSGCVDVLFTGKVLVLTSLRTVLSLTAFCMFFSITEKLGYVEELLKTGVGLLFLFIPLSKSTNTVKSKIKYFIPAIIICLVLGQVENSLVILPISAFSSAMLILGNNRRITLYYFVIISLLVLSVFSKIALYYSFIGFVIHFCIVILISVLDVLLCALYDILIVGTFEITYFVNRRLSEFLVKRFSGVLLGFDELVLEEGVPTRVRWYWFRSKFNYLMITFESTHIIKYEMRNILKCFWFK